MQAVPPYMMTVKNIPAIFDKIHHAGTPPRFTYEFLKANLGFGASGDRNIIAVLKNMGFLSEDGTPTERYNSFRAGGIESKRLIGNGLREGWPAVFLSDQKAYDKSVEVLKGIFQATTGKGDAVAYKMAQTFKAVADLGDFSAGPKEDTVEVADQVESSQDDAQQPERQPSQRPTSDDVRSLELHHDVHVHLPSTTDVAVYKAIFRALKDELSD